MASPGSADDGDANAGVLRLHGVPQVPLGGPQAGDRRSGAAWGAGSLCNRRCEAYRVLGEPTGSGRKSVTESGAIPGSREEVSVSAAYSHFGGSRPVSIPV